MRKTSFLILLAGILFTGCAYYSNYVHQFFADCRANVPEIRVYAVEHLQNLSENDKRIINSTEPKLRRRIGLLCISLGQIFAWLIPARRSTVPTHLQNVTH